MAIYLPPLTDRTDPTAGHSTRHTVIWDRADEPDGSEYDIATGSYRSWHQNRQRPPAQHVGTYLHRNWI